MIDGQIRDDPDRTVAIDVVTTDEPKEQLSSVAVTAPKALHQRQLMSWKTPCSHLLSHCCSYRQLF